MGRQADVPLYLWKGEKLHPESRAPVPSPVPGSLTHNCGAVAGHCCASKSWRSILDGSESPAHTQHEERRDRQRDNGLASRETPNLPDGLSPIKKLFPPLPSSHHPPSPIASIVHSKPSPPSTSPPPTVRVADAKYSAPKPALALHFELRTALPKTLAIPCPLAHWHWITTVAIG